MRTRPVAMSTSTMQQCVPPTSAPPPRREADFEVVGKLGRQRPGVLAVTAREASGIALLGTPHRDARLVDDEVVDARFEQMGAMSSTLALGTRRGEVAPPPRGGATAAGRPGGESAVSPATTRTRRRQRRNGRPRSVRGRLVTCPWGLSRENDHSASSSSRMRISSRTTGLSPDWAPGAARCTTPSQAR